MLHDSNQYKFVVVEDFGIVSQYAPRTIRGDIQTMVYVSKTIQICLYRIYLTIHATFPLNLKGIKYLC